jgi:hypothetical protein
MMEKKSSFLGMGGLDNKLSLIVENQPANGTFFFPTLKPMLKKPKEPLFANIKRGKQNLKK